MNENEAWPLLGMFEEKVFIVDIRDRAARGIRRIPTECGYQNKPGHDRMVGALPEVCPPLATTAQICLDSGYPGRSRYRRNS